MTQWDNFESMLYLKYARAEDNAQFNRCNVKYSFDILEDVLKIKHSTFTNNSQGLGKLISFFIHNLSGKTQLKFFRRLNGFS